MNLKNIFVFVESSQNFTWYLASTLLRWYCNIEVWWDRNKNMHWDFIKNVLQLIVNHPVRTWYSKKIRVPYESDASNDTNWEIITSCRVLSIERLNYTIIWKITYLCTSIISKKYFLLFVKCNWNLTIRPWA